MIQTSMPVLELVLRLGGLSISRNSGTQSLWRRAAWVRMFSLPPATFGLHDMDFNSKDEIDIDVKFQPYQRSDPGIDRRLDQEQLGHQ
jgi:hypothetical protein